MVLGNNLIFSICTHDPDTGILTDADSDPTYRVYEDETAAAILTGTMAVLDTGNTTGFYTEQIACTTANGFETGKSYTIYIEATVDGDKGGIAYGFTVDSMMSAIKTVTDALTAASATKLAASAGTIVSGAAAAGTLSTTQMTTNLTEETDDHYNGRIIIWTSGVLKDQATAITDYDGATKMLVYTAVTEAPTAADTFIIV